VIEYVCRVDENGRIPRSVSEDIGKIFGRMKGKEVSISIKKARKQRTNKQNAYYWCVVTYILEETGNTHLDPEEFHEWLKEHVGGLVTYFTGPDGVRNKVVRSSRNLSTAEFSEYVEKVIAWAASFEIIVPPANEHLTSFKT
jgi:hypothetical protein